MFGFAFHWLKNWRQIFKPITKRVAAPSSREEKRSFFWGGRGGRVRLHVGYKRSNCNLVTSFDSHLKTALVELVMSRSNREL